MLVVESFYRHFGEFTVSLKNWEIPSQGISFLWGDSGSGKSTIVKGLLGLDKQARGHWFYKNPQREVSLSAGELGAVFQDLGLFSNMSAQKNILFPVNKKKHPHWKEDFEQLTHSLELQALLPRSVQKLSGGEQQRVALARCLIYRPKILFLDEAFSSLDRKLKQKAQKIVKDFCKKNHSMALVVTHDPWDVKNMSEKDLSNPLSQIDKGKIFWKGSVKEFLKTSS